MFCLYECSYAWSLFLARTAAPWHGSLRRNDVGTSYTRSVWTRQSGWRWMSSSGTP